MKRDDGAGCGVGIESQTVKKSFDIVNIGLHFFHKDVRPYAASCSEA